MSCAHIRPARPEDVPGMLSVARALPEFFNDKGLMQMEKDFRQHQVMVAVTVEDEIVGFISSSLAEPGMAELTWLGVARDWQGRGIGRQLVEAIQDHCRSNDIRVLQVSTLADTVDYPPYSGTRAFYRRMGFEDWRIDSGYYGPGEDRLLLRKAI